VPELPGRAVGTQVDMASTWNDLRLQAWLQACTILVYTARFDCRVSRLVGRMPVPLRMDKQAVEPYL
jgi:hypothetical protein